MLEADDRSTVTVIVIPSWERGEQAVVGKDEYPASDQVCVGVFPAAQDLRQVLAATEHGGQAEAGSDVAVSCVDLPPERLQDPVVALLHKKNEDRCERVCK
jgi:hypothetical protein